MCYSSSTSVKLDDRLVIAHAKLISQTENGISRRTAARSPVKLHSYDRVDSVACKWLLQAIKNLIGEVKQTEWIVN